VKRIESPNQRTGHAQKVYPGLCLEMAMGMGFPIPTGIPWEWE